jgi:hypothetical protein
MVASSYAFVENTLFFCEVHPVVDGKHDPKLDPWHLPRSHVSTNQLGE